MKYDCAITSNRHGYYLRIGDNFRMFDLYERQVFNGGYEAFIEYTGLDSVANYLYDNMLEEGSRHHQLILDWLGAEIDLPEAMTLEAARMGALDVGVWLTMVRNGHLYSLVYGAENPEGHRVIFTGNYKTVRKRIGGDPYRAKVLKLLKYRCAIGPGISIAKIHKCFPEVPYRTALDNYCTKPEPERVSKAPWYITNSSLLAFACIVVGLAAGFGIPFLFTGG